LLPQLAAVIHGHRAESYARLAAQVSSAPGQSATLLRGLCYRLIGIPEPADRPALLDPLPLPGYQPPVRTAPLTALTRLLGAAPDEPPEIEVIRFAGPPPATGYTVHDTHTVVNEDCPDPSRLALASVIVRYGREDDLRVGPASAWTAETAARYPYAALTAFVSGPDRCTVRTADGQVLRLAAAPGPHGRPDLTDPAAYASALYAWLSNGKSVAELTAGMTVRTSGGVHHRVDVTLGDPRRPRRPRQPRQP
jgi:hypothetical protein